MTSLKKIHAKSATRVDLSGGTLDCWPLFLLVDGCITINLSISLSTEVTLEQRAGQAVEVHLRDLKYRKTFDNLASMLASPDADLRLLQKQLAYWRPEGGFYLETFSESPLGGGLGGSSSLSISLIKAFAQWFDRPLELYSAVHLSANLEAQVLHKMTGTQDYFPALVNGLNAIHYTPEGARLETIPTRAEFWDSHLSLVYTGQPHHSGINNWQVLKAALDGEKATLKALGDIRDVSSRVYESIQKERWEGLPELFDQEFEARVRLASSFSSPEIERLRKVALKSGALAVKICGAGGGGCVLVWSRPESKQGVEAGCRAEGFNVLNAKAVVQ